MRTLASTTDYYVCLQLLHVLSVRAAWYAESMLSWRVRSVCPLALFRSLCDVGYIMVSVEFWLLGASVPAICRMPSDWHLFSEKMHSVSHYADVVIMLVRNRSMNVYVQGAPRPWIVRNTITCDIRHNGLNHEAGKTPILIRYLLR